MDRRGFIGSILAACAAPAIVRADSLMRIVPRATGVLTLDETMRQLWLQYENSLVLNQWTRFSYYEPRKCLVAHGAGDDFVRVIRLDTNDVIVNPYA